MNEKFIGTTREVERSFPARAIFVLYSERGVRVVLREVASGFCFQLEQQLLLAAGGQISTPRALCSINVNSAHLRNCRVSNGCAR
jgi:hypothetical protein